MAARLAPEDLRHVDSALSDLAWNDIKRVALQLGVPQNKLSDIETENQTNASGRKLKAMDCWLQSDVEASWEKLVDTLKGLSLTATAQKIEKKYCSRSVPSATTSFPPATSSASGLTLSAMPSLAQLRRLKRSRGPDIRIIDQVAPKWDTLAITMDFDPKGDTLAAIRRDFSSVLDCCTETFRLWLDGRGNRQPATWNTLLEILDDCDLGNLVQDIKKVLDQ